MNAIDEGQPRALQRFRRRHIGENHELFNHAMSVETLALDHFLYGAVFVEHDAPLRQVEIKRRAFAALLPAGAKGRIKIVDGLGDEGRRRSALADLLRLLIGKFRMGAHNCAYETMTFLHPARIDNHLHREAGAVFLRALGA